ncbi:lytic murein transglycosylase B [Niveibacterium sp. 24ML]|uniref:lytic murein transglycosylase B n=1 Tax=Niveibacterium sp. 24ML TaxID=2985512 RepID=UPI0022712F06|nr:lytic murein transglycosylase B [Niveibacterium sp. 24ML]MCX9156057.1 lytic murein transglycosylase B [Niveibacterium sp. 24ML]
MACKKPLKALVAALLTTMMVAIHAAEPDLAPYESRDEVKKFAAEFSARESLDEGAILAALAEAKHLPAVIKYILPPASPTVKSWTRYRARFIDKTRINAGLAFWQEHESTLARAEEEFGVPAEIIVGIIGVETIYGRQLGNFQTLSALATLAFDYPPRAELFRRELGELFLLARDNGVPVGLYKGSYAGALGWPQFLPSSIRRYAVDYDGDGRISLESSPVDAIGSVASFLSQHGWETGGPIAVPAKVQDPQRAIALIEAGISPAFNRQDFERLGVSPDAPGAYDKPAALIDLVTPDAATEYWLGYQNFYVITRYNRSSFYAMTVYHLATAVKQARQQRPN